MSIEQEFRERVRERERDRETLETFKRVELKSLDKYIYQTIKLARICIDSLV